MANNNEVVTSSEAVVGDATISIEDVPTAKVILSQFLEEVRSDEQVRAASKISFEALIQRAIYSINKDTTGNDSSEDSILPYVENQSGCALERTQMIGAAIGAALDILEGDETWMSTLDMADMVDDEFDTITEDT